MSSFFSLLALPPATRALTGALVGMSLLLFALRLSLAPGDLKGIVGASSDPSLVFPWLVLLPGSVVWYPWTLLTGSFVESNLLEFLFSLFTLPLAARYLERVWGQVELLKFVFVVVVASNIIAVVVNVLESVVLGNKELFLYGMSYHGLMALQVGFLVAFTQLIPEHQVQVFGGIAKVRVKSLPMLYVTVSNVACLIGYQSPYILIQFGWIVSWFYLRFIKLADPTSDFRGDRSETFAFSSWFPPFIQPYVAKVAGIAFVLAVKVGVLRAWTDVEMGGYAAVPAMALKALDQRMATKPGSSASPRLATVASLAGQPAVNTSSASGSFSGPSGGGSLSAAATSGEDAVGVNAANDVGKD
ncbi:BZ3500_MvSof-1268-A1-R1_Chr7-1g09341 [Microbotryum saponariae]|uniref:BZ3500_MvSof-1268-A1-R1_Chr7-1g09341 protein n=1 Tax=Microbotryum saponariae TaxID=289078 RepID=A0A2X0LVC4_9BASI|nr:BZ3501_MvSof-1269-A2-R1_Chr7-1g09046 [Microbotryum saponariae]SDA03263.1 BZ3500_MvSof-1268-A1-R1_Chr7-1g09341 [Microbotryum saponariae]